MVHANLWVERTARKLDAMIDRLLTPADVAERCQVSSKTVLRAIHRGSLAASRLGESGAFRIRSGDVEAWIEASRVAPARRAESSSPTVRAPLPAERAVGRLRLTAEMGRH